MISSIALFLAAFLVSGTASAQTPTLEVTQKPVSIGTAARGAQRVSMLELTLKATCASDVTLETLTIHHRGLGDSADIVRIYAMQDGRRLTRSRAFDSKDRKAELRFRGMVIPACKEETLVIAADISPNAAVSGQHVLSLENAADLDLLEGEAILRSTSPAFSVRTAPVNKGVIRVSYPNLPGNSIRFGKNRLIGRIGLEADRESDHLIHALTLTNDGKARNTDLSNIQFVSGDGNVLSKVSSMEDDRIHFIFGDPIILRKNQSRQFQIRGDVTASRRKTIQLFIEEPSDIEATNGRTR